MKTSHERNYIIHKEKIEETKLLIMKYLTIISETKKN